MATEKKRGCGYRKIGGLYLVTDGGGSPCDRLPFELDVCPTCGGGIKPARGWSWFSPAGLFLDDHLGGIGAETVIGEGDFSEHEGFTPCSCPDACPVCHVRKHFEWRSDDGADGPDKDYIRAGLLWVGEQHYPRPQDFAAESALQGISRRISTLPKGFIVGHTWVFLAHRKCSRGPRACPDCQGGGLPQPDAALTGNLFCPRCKGSGTDEPTFKGIFMAFRPQRIERVVKQSEYDHFKALFAAHVRTVLEGGKWYNFVPDQDEIFWRLKRDTDRGITLVPVPDDDPDHQPRNGKEDD